MRKSDIGTGLLGLGSGLWLASAGHDLGIGNMNEPGSGFILFWIGLILAGLSAALAAVGAFGSGSGDGVPFGERWQNVPLVLFYLIVYSALLETVGFIPMTTALLLLLFTTVQPIGWKAAIFSSVAITLTVYVVFGVGLGTRFPAGILESVLVG